MVVLIYTAVLILDQFYGRTEIAKVSYRTQIMTAQPNQELHYKLKNEKPTFWPAYPVLGVKSSGNHHMPHQVHKCFSITYKSKL